MRRGRSFYDIIAGISATITRRGTRPVADIAAQATSSVTHWGERMAPSLVHWAERHEELLRSQDRSWEGTIVQQRRNKR
jgi:antitoxin (DNA-binding transcriptional repressor) of toxin-antitoxin stability system